MGNENRTILENGKKIVLCENIDGKSINREFIIDGYIGEGGSIICYNAHHSTSGIGVLKEFYPVNNVYVKRDESGHIVSEIDSECFKEEFKKAKEDYLRPYNMFLKAFQNDDNKDIATFILPFTLLYDNFERNDSEGSVYVWYNMPESVSFKEICTRYFEKTEPEEKLYIIMKSIESLTNCIRILHLSDMIHRDIKPENFGFMSRQGEVLYQFLILFDIDTVVNIFDEEIVSTGTPGYCEPETEDIDNKTDIYSIGATLYYALFGTVEKKFDLSKISRMIDELDVIKNSEINRQEAIRALLCRILRKCLADKRKRYCSCEELLSDLKDMLSYLLPPDNNGRWSVKSKNKKINQIDNQIRNLQYQLYKNPLYKWQTECNEINILLIGFDSTAQKYLDLCLEVCQRPFGKVNADIILSDEEKKTEYLERRPELSRFFSIDDVITDDNYGSIRFFPKVTKNEMEEIDKHDIYKCIRRIVDEQNLNSGCFFVSIGDDNLNLLISEYCAKFISEKNMNGCVSCILNTGTGESVDNNTIIPININFESKKSDIHSEIERMAYNAHLIWEKDLLDYTKSCREFRKRYNYNSSVSNIISMKYKLYSIGIDIDKLDIDTVARKFKDIYNQNEDLIDLLVWSEHKRWVTEKITDGWTQQDDLRSFDSGITKDDAAKKHAFILRSTPGQILTKEYNSNGTCEKWDKASESEIECLDELDKASVKLHRIYSERANLYKGTVESEIEAIKELVSKDNDVFIPFMEWYSCIHEINNNEFGKNNKSQVYFLLRDLFYNSLERSSLNNIKYIKEKTKSFEKTFRNVLESVKYTDYKLIDKKLIDNIPFILTHRTDICLAIPFMRGNNTNLFSDIAVAAIINPSNIIYISQVSDKSDISEIAECLTYLNKYKERKNIRSKIEFLMLCKDDVLIDDNLKKQFKLEYNVDLKTEKTENEDNIALVIQHYLNRKKRPRLYLEKNASQLSAFLKGAGVYSAFKCYEFDMKTQTFINVIGCEDLLYINRLSSISVRDMFSAKYSESNNSNKHDLYFDYKDLWDKYHENTDVWKNLCGTLIEYEEKNGWHSNYKIDLRNDNSDEIKLLYIVPVLCIKTVNNIICEALKKKGIDVTLKINSTHCWIKITDKASNKKVYDLLFADPYILMDYEHMKVVDNKPDYVQFKYDSLVVRNLDVSKLQTDELNLMNFLTEKGIITGFKENNYNNTVSFVYSTHQTKELLTNEGKMLEVYVYHKIIETRAFDDVVSNLIVNWEGTENEFDCVLTKGFNSVFIECKAKSKIEQDHYYKLKELSEYFGINPTAVLIADTEDYDKKWYSANNDVQEKRGKALNVITIRNKEDIENIGEVIVKKIMNNK